MEADACDGCGGVCISSINFVYFTRSALMFFSKCDTSLRPSSSPASSSALMNSSSGPLVSNKVCKMWKLMLAMVVGVFVSVFSFGAFSAQAAETSGS